MLKSVEISDFRCFRQLRVNDCAPINVIVGDNGVGKTSFLEAVFLAMSGTPEKGLLLKQYRDGQIQFAGQMGSIVDTLFAEFFPNSDLTRTPSVKLKGSKREENRSLLVKRGASDVQYTANTPSSEPSVEVLSPLYFEWTIGRKKHRAGISVGGKGMNSTTRANCLATIGCYTQRRCQSRRAKTPIAFMR